jgi:hypothetical protein
VVLPVLHLDPVLLSAALVSSIAMLRYQTFEPKLTGLAKQIRPDLALLKGAHKDPVGPPCHQSKESGLAHREG